MDELDSTKRAWTAEERRALAAGEIKGGFAGPNNSYPIAGPADVGDAWGLAGQAANPDQVRRAIIRIARKFGWLSSLPASAEKWAEDNGVSIKTGEFTGDEDDKTTKAGRRLAGAKLTAAQEALATLVGIVKWAAYDDGEDTSEDDAEDAAEAKASDDLEGIEVFDAHETKDVDYAIKAIAPGRIRGYAVLWGNEAQKDLTGEWFTPRTEELETVFKSIGRLPWLYHHGGDGRVKSIVAGVVDAMGRDEIGLWYEAQRLMADDYDKYIDALIDQGKLRTSSGALPRSRAVTKSGEIKRWAIMEVSGTPVPADWRQRDFPVAAIKTLPDDDDQAKGAEKARQIAIELERLELLKLR